MKEFLNGMAYLFVVLPVIGITMVMASFILFLYNIGGSRGSYSKRDW